MAVDPDSVPHALLHNLKHNKVLHERVVFLTVRIRDVPWVPCSERVAVEPLGQGFYRLKVRLRLHGPARRAASLELCKSQGLDFDLMQTTFFLSRAIVVQAIADDGPGGDGGVAREPVRDHGAQRPYRGRLLQHPGELRHRTRHQDRDLVDLT